MNFIYPIIIIILGFISVSFFKKEVRQSDVKVLYKLWAYHLLFAFIFGLFFKGDANYYWATASSMDAETFKASILTKLGTYFIFSFNYIPAAVLKMSFLSGTLLHGFYGFIGICCFYVITLKFIPKNSYWGNTKLFPFLFFLPNLHFWTVGIGKDSTSFLFLGLFFYSFINIKTRFLLAIASGFLLYLIRPHVALFAIAALGISFLVSKQATNSQRFILSVLILGASFFILPKVMEYSKIENLSSEDIENFSSTRTGNLSRSHTESRIDISSYPYPLKVFTFLYRPLFFDAHNVNALLASIENLILLVLSFKAFKKNPIKSFKAAPLLVQALFIFLLVGSLAFSLTLSNLGIMLRMRNMFLPALIISILWYNYYNSNPKFK